LRHTPWRRRNSHQFESTQRFVSGRDFAFALQHVHGNRCLVVLGGGEYLALAGRNRGVFIDQPSHHTAHGLDAQRQRGDIQQQHVFDIAFQHRALNGGAQRHDLVGIDALVRCFSEDLLHAVFDRRHAGHSAHQNDLVDIRCRKAGILQRLTTRALELVEKIGDQRFQPGTRDPYIQMLRASGVGGNEGQIHFGFQGRGQLHFGFLCGILQSLQRHFVLAQIDALILFELVGQIVDQAQIEIFSAQVRVAVGGFDFEHSVAEFEDRNVESTSAQIEYGDFFIRFLIEPVGQGGRGRLVDDAQDVQTGDFASILGGLALAVAKIGRDGNDRIGDGCAQKVLGRFFDGGQHEG